MKILFAMMMIAAAIFTSGFILRTNPLYVDGKLIVHNHKNRNCHFEIVVKGDQKVLASANADSTGNFKLSFTPGNEKSFDFFYIDSHHAADTIYLKSYTDFDSDQLQVTFYTFKGVVAVDEYDQVICPKCQSSDDVKPLKGLPGYYYCAKDKIKF